MTDYKWADLERLAKAADYAYGGDWLEFFKGWDKAAADHARAASPATILDLIADARRTPAPEGEVVGGALFDCNALTDRLVDLAVRLETKADNASASKSELAPGIFRECMADSEAIRLAVAILQDRAPGGATWKQRAAEFAEVALKNAIALQPHLAPSPAPEGEVAWRWRNRPDGVWNYQEARQRIPGVEQQPLYASPVVPVGVSEADINELRVVCDTNQAATDDSRIVRADDLPIGVIRRILAALRPTDTGRG